MPRREEDRLLTRLDVCLYKDSETDIKVFESLKKIRRAFGLTTNAATIRRLIMDEDKRMDRRERMQKKAKAAK